jgi:predicted nucleic acid-binding protein
VAESLASFLDNNVLLRFLTRDDEDKARAALALLEKVERGEERVAISSLVIFETVFTLQKSYAVERERIQSSMLSILGLRGLECEDRSVHTEALEVFGSSNLSFADAYNAAYMHHRGLRRIYSWDADFDRVSGIERLEPSADQDEDESLGEDKG